MKNSRNFLALILALSLTISLASCGSKNGAGSQPEPQASVESVSSSVPESSSEPEPKSSAAELNVAGGKILAMGDSEFGIITERKAGSRYELEKWKEIISSPNIATIDACDMHQEEAELSSEQANAIVKILKSADVGIYESLGNPVTGGAVWVIAYDSSSTHLFRVLYDGMWFSVAFGTDSTAYVFDGEGTSLDELSSVI